MELGGDKLMPEWTLAAHPRATVGGEAVEVPSNLPLNKHGYVSIDIKDVNFLPTVGEGTDEQKHPAL